MMFGKWTRVLLFATPFMAGCAGFWVSPNNTGSSNTSFSLSNSGNISVSPGATTGNTSSITVTPANSFTGTVDVTCAISSAPSGATSPICSLSPTSVSITSSTAASTTLTVTTTSSTTTGSYNITVTGTSGSLSATTTLCAEVSTSSGTCTAATASGVFYVLNRTTSQIVALSISSTGSLTTVSSTSLSGLTPLVIAVAPNGKFLYTSTAAGIFVYTIGSNGALTLGNSGQAIVQDPATTMAVDATSGWLVEAISGSNQVSAFNVNSSTGLFVSAGESPAAFNLPSITTTQAVTQLAISPNDSSSCSSCYVFVAMGTGGTELVHFNPGSSSPFGTAAHLNLKNSSQGGAGALAVDPQNRLLYVGETAVFSSPNQTGGLRALTIGTGGVTEISGSPYASGGAGPTSILPSSDGNFVYAANQAVSGSSNGLIASFSVSSSALTSVGNGISTAALSGTMSLAEDNTGSYVLLTDSAGNPDLEAFTTNAGVLTSVLQATTGTDPVGAAAVAALP